MHRQERDPGVRVSTLRPAHPRFVPEAQAVEFQGLGPTEQYGGSFYSFTPGEPSVAVGSNDIVETVNEAAAVFDKSGHKLAEFDFGTFWGGTDANPTFCTDPRALYLTSGQFAISCSDNTSGVSNPMRFAISKTSDPTGAWYLYAAPNTMFLDQDKIVATSDKFIIAGNTSSTEVMYVYNLADVEAGVTKPKVITRTATMSNIYEAVVEQTFVSQAYFVSSFPGNSLYLATVTGTPAAGNVKLKETHVTASDFPAPQNPQVPGGSYDGGDGRVLDAVYEVESSDGKPVIQYSSTRVCGTRDCLTSARIDLSGTKPVLRYDALVGEPGWDYTYGAVGLDATGNVFEAYSRSNASTTPDSGVVGPGFDVTLQPSTPGTLADLHELTVLRAVGRLSPDGDRSRRYDECLGHRALPVRQQRLRLGNGDCEGVHHHVLAAGSCDRRGVEGHRNECDARRNCQSERGRHHISRRLRIDHGVRRRHNRDVRGLGDGHQFRSLQAFPGCSRGPHITTASLQQRRQAARPAPTAPSRHHPQRSRQSSSRGQAPTRRSRSRARTSAPSRWERRRAAATADFDFGSLLSFQEISQGWAAGGSGDCIGLIVTSYAPTQVVYQFGSNYTMYGPVTAGDQFSVTVQTAKFSGTVAYS